MVSATYKILLEQTSDGQSSATVLEIPDCQAIAITPQEAISQVQARLTDRLATAQIVSIQIPAGTFVMGSPDSEQERGIYERPQ